MADFGTRFFICNIFICAIIGILLIIKQVLINQMTSRMQFNLWFMLLGLLTVPLKNFTFAIPLCCRNQWEHETDAEKNYQYIFL